MYRLYWSPHSASLAPELVLAEGGLPFEKVLVDIRRGDNRTPAYRAINPAGFVPALVTPEGDTITETAAIVLSLCERHALPLAPGPGETGRERFLRWVLFLSNMIQTTYKRYYYPQRFSTDEAAAPGIKARAVAMQDEHWQLVEDHLAARGPHVLGETISAADLYLSMLVTWYPDPRALATRLPALGRCFAAVLERPIVRRVMQDYGDLPPDWARDAAPPS